MSNAFFVVLKKILNLELLSCFLFKARPDRIDASIRAAQIAFCKKKVIAAKDLLAVTVRQTDEPI